MSDRDIAIDIGKIRKFEHPGRGRERGRSVPKGRQVDPHAQAAIEALLAGEPRERTFLIEYLHRIQDTYGQISAAHLAALAEVMGLAFAEVFETATFYAHFDVVKEGTANIPALTVRVCDSLTCAMFGANQLLAALQGELGEQVRVVRAPCVGLCDHAPAAEVGHNFLKRATTASVKAAVAHQDTHPHIPDYIDYDAYRAAVTDVSLSLEPGKVTALI
ncbi:MAG: NAD(P)H-dependent oxidoreductase subunit E, partial [Steroidobacteraceae bacterium]